MQDENQQQQNARLGERSPARTREDEGYADYYTGPDDFWLAEAVCDAAPPETPILVIDGAIDVLLAAGITEYDEYGPRPIPEGAVEAALWHASHRWPQPGPMVSVSPLRRVSCRPLRSARRRVVRRRAHATRGSPGRRSSGSDDGPPLALPVARRKAPRRSGAPAIGGAR
jgi:hypothetical protein